MLLGFLEFWAPGWLLALAFVAVLVRACKCSNLVLPSRQRLALTLCRTAIVVLIVTAMAQPVYRGTTGQKYAVFVADTSASVTGASQLDVSGYTDEASQLRGRHQAATLLFADRQSVLRQATDPAEDRTGRYQSDPSAAVLRARAMCPLDNVPEVVLLTDGNQTRGDLLGAVIQADMPVDVVPEEPFPSDEVCLADVVVPATARAQSTFGAEIVVTSNHADEGRLSLQHGSRVIQARDISVQPGSNRFRFDLEMAADGRLVITAQLEGFTTDTIQDNNLRRGVVYPSPRPRIMLVNGQPESARYLAAVLRGRGYQVTAAVPTNLPQASSDLNLIDGVILFGTAASDLTAAQFDVLDHYVRGGGGLLVAGGKQSFGSNTYRQTRLERMMPVAAADLAPQLDPTLGLVLVIDQSGSMRREGRMELAKEAAKKSIQLLKPRDQIGVITFGDETQWVSDMVPGRDKATLLKKIDTIEARGATNMYPALQKAYLALDLADVDRKQMIVLTDGIPSPGDFHKLAVTIAEAGIAVATVSVGEGADQLILDDIARLAGGEHHHCEDPANVPEVLVEVTRKATRPDPSSFRPYVLRRLPGLPMDDAPPMTDFAETSPKPRTELVLVTPSGAPLLSWWRYGTGVAMALTSNSPRGVSAEWRDWRDFGTFWDRIVADVIRRNEPRNYNIAVGTWGQTVTVTVDAVDDDARFINDGHVKLQLTTNHDQQEQKDVRRDFSLPLVAPGRYQAQIDVGGPGIHELQIEIENADGIRAREMRGVAIDFPEELQLTTLNQQLLQSVAQASGGRYDPPPQQIFDDDGRRVPRVTQLWPWLVCAAVVLFVFDVGLRRWPEFSRVALLGSLRRANVNHTSHERAGVDSVNSDVSADSLLPENSTCGVR